MARRANAHSFAKRQKELKRIKKQQEKRAKRQGRPEDEPGGEMEGSAGFQNEADRGDRPPAAGQPLEAEEGDIESRNEESEPSDIAR